MFITWLNYAILTFTPLKSKARLFENLGVKENGDQYLRFNIFNGGHQSLTPQVCLEQLPLNLLRLRHCR